MRNDLYLNPNSVLPADLGAKPLGPIYPEVSIWDKWELQDGKWNLVTPEASQSEGSELTEWTVQTHPDGGAIFKSVVELPELFGLAGLPTAVFVSVSLDMDVYDHNDKLTDAFDPKQAWSFTLDTSKLFEAGAQFLPESWVVIGNSADITGWVFGRLLGGNHTITVTVDTYWASYQNESQLTWWGAIKGLVSCEPSWLAVTAPEPIAMCQQCHRRQAQKDCPRKESAQGWEVL